MQTVYLAGSIGGCDFDEANDWRDYAYKYLKKIGIRGISPLRCEPLPPGQKIYEATNPDPMFGTARAIASKNLLDVQKCDVTLCYMPKSLNERRMSLGTIIELAWAHALNKPTILVTDYDVLEKHPVVQANAGWIVPTLDQGLKLIEGLLSEYVERT